MSRFRLMLLTGLLLVLGTILERAFSSPAKTSPTLSPKLPIGQCGKSAVPPRIVSGSGSTTTQRIVGGIEARPNSYPFIVSLQTGEGFPFCGGSLIRVTPESEKTDIVLTAAHCVADGTLGVAIVAGSHSISEPDPDAQTVNIRRTIIHSDYDNTTGNNDIAILLLNRPIKFNDKAQPICLPKLDELMKDGTVLTVAGWGLLEDGDKVGSDVLMQVQVPTANIKTCIKKMKKEGLTVNSVTMICAGYKTGGKDSCEGDSGGPMFSGDATNDYILRGLVSFGSRCAGPEVYGVYTKVSYYMNWIKDIITLQSHVV